jgi:hypothetical protein
VEGGKFCRNGINCRGRRPFPEMKNPDFIGLFAMARRLLMLGGKYGPRDAALVGV